MNVYKITTNYEGTKNFSTYSTKAQTPYDATEKAEKWMTKRERLDVTKHTVMIMDGSQTIWQFCKHKNKETIEIPFTDEVFTICHDCGEEL